MRFFIYPKLDGRHYEIIVEYFPARLLSDPERFVVHGKKRIFIESNRPFFRNKGIKHRRPDYKLITKDMNAAATIYVLGTKKLKKIKGFSAPNLLLSFVAPII